MRDAQIKRDCISYTNRNDCIRMQQKTGCRGSLFFMSQEIILQSKRDFLWKKEELWDYVLLVQEM